MAKTIIKELGIVLLLLVAVILVLAILFYEYIPNNKTVPIKIQEYKVPEDIKQELQESIPTEQNIVRTYYIDSTDLNLYESTNDYDKGKANPFADYTDKVNNTIEDNPIDGENEVYINTPGKNY